MELDLSECIITPEQIAQALGRVPNKEELAKILAPKKKDNKKGFTGYDMTSLFLGDGKEFGVWNVVNDKGISIDTLLKVGKKVFRHGVEKPEAKDNDAVKDISNMREQQAKTHNEELRKIIEERKRKELENRAAKKQEFQQEIVKESDGKKDIKSNVGDKIISRGRDGR